MINDRQPFYFDLQMTYCIFETTKLNNMQSAILNSNSKTDLKLLLNLAKKLGIKTRMLTDLEIEDIGLANAIKAGRTGEHIDTQSFLNELRK